MGAATTRAGEHCLGPLQKATEDPRTLAFADINKRILRVTLPAIQDYV
jgi:hypothetical protein